MLKTHKLTTLCHLFNSDKRKNRDVSFNWKHRSDNRQIAEQYKRKCDSSAGMGIITRCVIQNNSHVQKYDQTRGKVTISLLYSIAKSN
jgi:hypothetical protein